MTTARLALLALLLLLTLAACGDEPDAEPAAAPATTLTISVWPQGRSAGDATVRELECPPHADDPKCVRVAELGPDVFAPVPGNAACTQIYGGPQEARVEGAIEGTPVDAELSRSNGCEIARWDGVRAIVPVPTWTP
jgi:predicted small lipoprotein YifL